MVMMRKPSISTQQLKTVLKQNSYSFLHYKHDLRQLQILWKKRFGNIETDIADSKRFIKCVTILWDEHFGRVSDLQTFIRMDLENVISKNTYQAETAEYKFNLIVDKIRQQPTEQKLMKTLAEAYKYLNSLENMYSTHDKTEIAAVEKYMDYIKVETEILRAEVKRFLNIFTIDPYYDPKSQRPRASRTNLLEDPTECLIASDIQYCQYETDLLKNWMFGIWDALDNYWANCIEELLEEAKAYVNSKIENIKEKTAIKRAFNKTRFDRIKHSIYMRRLEEINIHQERITIHQQGIDDGIQKLKQKMLIVENRLKQKVSDYHEDLSKQSKYIGKLSDSKQILVCMKIMNQGNIVTKEEMKKVVDNFKKKCDDFLDDIKYSDLEFRKTIRLFSEEGTFSSDEAKDVVKKLTKIEKKAIKALDSLFKELKKQESKYGDSLDKVILNIQDETSNCMEAFQHNEKTVSIITDLQKHIQEDVYEVKFSMKKQMDSIEDMKEEMRKNLGEMDICEKYETDLKNNIRSLETMKKYLMHPEPVTAIKNLTLCKLLENDKAAEEQSESHSNSEAIIEDIYGFNTDEMKDYTSLLFDKKPVEEDNYLSKLNSRLYKTFQTIQTSARAFYGGHSNEVMEGVSTDKVQPTYSRFMEEICQKYKCYQIQYEMNWIDNVNNFVNSVQSLTSFTKKYNSDFLDSIRHNTKNKLKINHNFINDNMMNHLNEIENNYMSIHNKLKVLHGHPNNKHLLDELHMEMKMLKDANTDKLQLMAEPLKENYISEYNDLIQKFETAANFFKSFTENIDALAGFTDDLEKQVDTKIKLTEEYIAANKPFQADHELNLDKLFTNLLSKVRPSAKSSGKSETSQIFEDMKDHWEEYYQKNVKDLEAIMKNHLEQVDHTVVKDPIIHDKYQSMWESDIKKISDMYSVKYSK